MGGMTMNKFIALTSFQDAMYALTEDGRMFRIVRNHDTELLVCQEVMRLPNE